MSASPSAAPEALPDSLLSAVPPPLRDEAAAAWKGFTAAAAAQGVDIPCDRDFRRTLLRVWAASPFVAESCLRDPGVLRNLLDQGDLHRAYAAGEYSARLHRAVGEVADQASLMTALRRLRRREMVRIIWRDLAGWAELEEILEELTALADACVSAAVQWLDQGLRKQYGAPRCADGTPAHLVVLAMGKQGAGELNVSTDIDLIFAYSGEGQTRKRGGISNHEFFTRLGQGLIEVLDRQTADGFVFRVDMRLRPYGDSGPLAVGFDAIEEYYQSQGREWERYAMIKARPVAGPPEEARRLQEILRPFVYRRYLDFGAFESLRDMKGLIMRQVRRKGMEDNIKLGPGGIREVEFIGQAFQLIRGGREPSLQVRGILPLLRHLQRLDYLPRFVVDELTAAYRFLRRLENRLQAARDEQVHSLPGDERERARLAFAMGCAQWQDLIRALDRHRRKVHSHFEQVFAAPQADDEAGARQDLDAVWQEGADDGQAEAALARAGFERPEEALRLLHRLQADHPVRGLSAHGRDRLDRLLPMLLGAVSQVDRPNETLLRLIRLLESIVGRTAYLALLVENPMALSQLVKLCAASPWLAMYLSQHPLLLDELLDPRTLYRPLDRTGLRAELRGLLAEVPAGDLERQMEVLRQFKQTNVLRVAAADVANAMPLMVVSDHLTYIAEVVLEAVLDLAWETLVARHGAPPGGGRAYGGFAVIAYGKLGGFELGYGSDLDLVFLHHSGSDRPTTGPKPLDQAVFFARLGQRIIHLLHTMTPSGVLYEVDLRLRPSGASGLLVSTMEAFADYQRTEAWTWEQQALVRARPVAGDPQTAREFERLRLEVLTRKRDAEQLRGDVREMRRRMGAELARGGAGQFDLKQGPGGLTDIEFLVQYAVLRWAAQFPDLVEYTDNIRQLDALSRNGLLSEERARLLADAYRAYRRRIHALTLQEEPAVVPAEEFADCRERVRGIWEEWMTADDTA